MAKKEPLQLQGTKRFIRNFLRINDSREFLMFLFFLLISFVIWYLTTMDNVYEMKYTLKLELKNLPETMIVTEPLPKEMEVVLKDKGDKLVEYKARGRYKSIQIDYGQYPSTAGRTAIYGSELNKLLSTGLASSTEIISTSLDTLQYYVAEARGVKLPLRMQGKIVANRQYVIDRVSINPDSVTVYAAKQITDTMTAVYTPYVKLVELTDSVQQTLVLGGKERGIRYVPSEAQLNVSVSPYVTKSVQVPIVGYMFPYGHQLKTFPSKATVTFRVSLEDFRKVTEEDFRIQVHYAQIRDNASGKVELRLANMPDNITDVTIEPTEADYLVEINPLGFN